MLLTPRNPTNGAQWFPVVVQWTVTANSCDFVERHVQLLF